MIRIIPAILLFTFLINSSLTYSSNFKTKEITWSELRKLNYKTGEMPDSLSLLVGQSIKIPGFAVPFANFHDIVADRLDGYC